MRIEPDQSEMGWNGQWGRAKIMWASRDLTLMSRMTELMTSVQPKEAKKKTQEEEAKCCYALVWCRWERVEDDEKRKKEGRNEKR